MSRIAVLGASGTIGRTLCRRLVKEGHSLVMLGRDPDKLSPLSQELDQPFAVVDVAGSQDLEDQLRSQLSSGDGIQGLVNCIGSLSLKPAHSTSDEEFRQVIETNLFSAFAAVRAGATILREQGGSIVLIASAAAEVGIQNHEAISAAKAGVIGLARAAAATYAPDNIRVNVVSPGLVRTDMTRRIWENPASAKGSVEMHALGRLGEPEHVASLISWLLNPENDWVTGQVIGVDGGLGHLLPRRRSPG
jgi:3-oxoacyl-[acyl-carrier protein] reductase